MSQSQQFNEYLQKKALHDQLSRELEELEQKEGYQQIIEYQNRIEELNKEFGYSLGQSLEMIESMITPFDQQMLHHRRAEDRPRRKMPKPPMKRYTNPHTGEVVKAKRVNHMRLRAWIKEYGREEVDNWGVEINE